MSQSRVTALLEAMQHGDYLLSAVENLVRQSRRMLDAFRGPFGQVKFCPTGGITLDLARDYLTRPNVACVGGGWVCPARLIDAKKWDEIGALAREAASLPRV